MKAQYNFKYDGKIDNFPENEINEKLKNPNNLKLLNDKNISRNNFFNKDNGKFLNIDYIPKELFSSNMIKNKKDNNDDKAIINNIQNPFNFESNNLKSSCLGDKNNDLKSSKNNENNNDFKISQNEFNISQSHNKGDNILSSNLNSNNQNMSSNLHLTGNINKETNSNQRYNEEINQSISKNKNTNINNILSNESSTLRQNLSNYNGLSDNFINSHLEISNTLTNNSNILSSQNNYLEKVKLRELDDKEKFLIELEAKRNKNISDLIEKEKIEFSKKEKDLENKNKITNENFLIERNKLNNSKQKIKNSNKNSQNIICNNENISIKKDDNINSLNKNNEIIFSYFNQVKKENIKNGRNSYLNIATHPNYRTSSSFYSKRNKIISPSISSATNDNKNINHQYYTSTNFKIEQKKKISKISKSSKKLNSSQKNISNSSSHIMKSLRSNEYNPQASFQMINLFKNNNKRNQKRRNKYYNPKGKEKIQEKYNIYFNCFIPSLYEEQKQKLLNEKNMKKSKSTTKIKKLEDYIGPNLYNEKVESPDFGYICYKTNKKINPKYSLNYNNGGTFGNINTLNNQHFPLNINVRNIYNDYEDNKNNYENENDIMDYPNKINNQRNRNNYYKENQNYYKTEYNDELINEIIYHDLYNKAFNRFNFSSNNNYQLNSYNDDIK